MFLILLSIFFVYFTLFFFLNYKKFKNKNKNKIKLAFFHPFCNDGGGGQKVLWCMIQALFKQKQNESAYEVAIFSLQKDKQMILNKVKSRFDVNLTLYANSINIIQVQSKAFLTPKRKLTMIFHIILPIIYCIKCLFKYQPDIFYDTTGYASTLFITKILLPSCKTVAYVHYPFISQDMIQKVRERRSDFNNDQNISKSSFKTKLKLAYYTFVYYLYKLNGLFVDYAQTNSSWTHNHMKSIWRNLADKQKLVKLYPPCSVKDLTKFNKNADAKEIVIMSLAQFRPQKNQKSQIKIVQNILKIVNSQKMNCKVVLYICGTTRGIDDQKILQQLKESVKQKKLDSNVQFKVNKPFSQILKYLENALIGIHTMEAEHFGISVVQMLAAGLIVVAHNSAGPKEDIICDENYLGISQQDYTNKILRILKMNEQQKKKVIEKNRKNASRFGQQQFQKHFNEVMTTIKPVQRMKAN